MGLRGLWVCGSGCQQGLGVCGHGCMAGLGVWGLLERKCEEKGRTKSAKEMCWEHFRSFLRQFWKKRAEKESTGPKSAFRRFSEVPSTTKSTVCFRCWLSWGPSGEVSGAFRKLFRTILRSIFGTIEHRKQKGRRSLPLEPARAGSTLARSRKEEKATQKQLKTRAR